MTATVARTGIDTTVGDAPEQHSTRHEGRFVFLTIGVLLSIVFVGPLLFAALRSLQDSVQVTSPPNSHSLDHVSLSNYSRIFTRLPFWHFLANSAIVSIGGALGTVVVSTMAGYGLGRFRFRGRGIVFSLVLIVLLVPFQALLTPIYLEFNKLGLVDSQFGLILFYVTFNLPFGVFVMRNTFAGMPTELEEAAYVDGAGTISVLFRVLGPLCLPGIATTFLFTFLNSWTEFLGAFTFLTSEDKQTLPIALLNLQQGSYGEVNFGSLLAGSVISMIPCLLLYVALQRYYVQGMLSGAVKA